MAMMESASMAPPAHVVGIGASAGGLEALERMFAHLPPDTGCAFVVVQHLAPDFRSLMDELLQRRTDMAVLIASNNMPLARNTVHLIPPGHDMIVSSGHLLLTERNRAPQLNLPIDMFFKSLAADFGENAAAVVLSGTGSDGARGVQAVHEVGGWVLAQEPSTAGFDGMPNAAITTGAVDLVVDPSEIGQRIIEWVGHDRSAEDFDPLAAAEQEGYSGVFALLSEHHGVNFHHYKLTTIARRLERRQKLAGCRSIPDYLRLLEASPTELADLYRDLLIGVTEFFRDPEVWMSLSERELPRLIGELPPDGELRCWVAGTATGQEAYTMAILVYEAFRAIGRAPSARIFATDLHKSSLEFAGAGIYPADDLEHLSPEFRSHFVDLGDGNMQISSEIRRLVVFAHHNLIADPPFTKLDLISCRNLLIYLRPTEQRRVLTRFHFGLRRGGVLMLGSSETLGDLEPEFDTQDRRGKIYLKRRDGRIAVGLRELRTSDVTGFRPPIGTRSPMSGLPHQLLPAYDALLSDYVPAAFLIDSHGTLLHTFGGATELLQAPSGRTSIDAASLIHPDLKVALVTGVQRVLRDGKPVVFGGLRVALPDGERVVTLRLRTVGEHQRDELVLVAIEFEDPSPPPDALSAEPLLEVESSEHMLYLESELRYARENLQATVEELETTNEELQATNEELTASNEELQSSNEELHSVNEELYSVNREYESKIEELTQLTSDMDNLLGSTRIGTVFLDTTLRIRKFTDDAVALFNLLPQDIGRPIAHMTRNLDLDELDDDLHRVVNEGAWIEREVQHHDGTWYLMRLNPYVADGRRVAGVVITFVNIQTMKHVSARLERRTADLQGFAYGVSHDMQEPIRAILGFADLVVRRYGEAALDDSVKGGLSAQTLLEQVSRAADRLRMMTDAMLTYSRVETLAGPITEVDLDELLGRVLDSLKSDIVAAEAEVTVGSLGSVRGDPVQLEWVWGQLITNSLEARADRALKVSVERCASLDGLVQFAVTDNGSGVLAADRQLAFEMFRRLPPKTLGPSLGVGLTIVRRIVERHGGIVEFDDVEVGSRILLSLPAVGPTSAAAGD